MACRAVCSGVYENLRGGGFTCAISPTSISRCWSKYVFSGAGCAPFAVEARFVDMLAC